MSWPRVSLMVALLALFTVGFHAVSHGERVPARRPLATVPMQIGDWQGQDVSLDARVVNILKADDLLMRMYRAPDQPPLWLYIAYFQSQRQGETIHSPKNCLPGSGWEPLESHREDVVVAPGRSVTLNRYIVENGLDRQLVFYWYQSHGRSVASEYRAKGYMVMDALRMNRTDGALVRVSIPLLGNPPATEQIARDFVRQLYPLLNQFIPE